MKRKKKKPPAMRLWREKWTGPSGKLNPVVAAVKWRAPQISGMSPRVFRLFGPLPNGKLEENIVSNMRTMMR